MRRIARIVQLMKLTKGAKKNKAGKSLVYGSLKKPYGYLLMSGVLFQDIPVIVPWYYLGTKS